MFILITIFVQFTSISLVRDASIRPVLALNLIQSLASGRSVVRGHCHQMRMLARGKSSERNENVRILFLQT